LNPLPPSPEVFQWNDLRRQRTADSVRVGLATEVGENEYNKVSGR
jgi:hypothetical protein